MDAELTERGFSYPLFLGNGEPASRRDRSAFAEGLRRDRQECPPSFILIRRGKKGQPLMFGVN